MGVGGVARIIRLLGRSRLWVDDAGQGGLSQEVRERGGARLEGGARETLDRGSLTGEGDLEIGELVELPFA